MPDFARAFFNYPTQGPSALEDRLAFLADRSDADWAKLLSYTETRRFSIGETIVRAGEVDRTLYLLTRGRLAVAAGGGRSSAFKEVEAPSLLGEVAFLDGGPRSASLIAVTDGELVRLSHDSFEVLDANEPELGRAILLDLARILAARLRMLTDVVAATGS